MRIGRPLRDVLFINQVESDLRCVAASEALARHPIPPVYAATLRRTVRADEAGRVTDEQFWTEIRTALDALRSNTTTA